MAVADEDSGAAAKPLGLWMATALVVGSMIGSGVFLLPAALAPYGAASLIGWAITLCGALLLAATFARLAVANPATGGPYAYARRAFGDFVGFQTAWGYWIAVWAGNAAIAVAFVGYLAHFWHALGTNKPLAAGVGLAAIWVLTAVNAYGVRQGGVVQVVTTVVKLVPLLLIAVGGLFFIKSANFGPFNASGTSAFSAVTAAAPDGTVFAYLYDVDTWGRGKLITHAPQSWIGRPAGHPIPLDVALYATGYDLPPGHRLALVLDSSDPLYAGRTPLASAVTFGSPAVDPSTLTVPLR